MSVGSGISAPAELVPGDSTAGTDEPDRDWQARLETFVGREREMQTLRSRIDEAIDGRGSLVLVSGEPGIGKTRLLTEASKYAESKEMTVLWGRCWEGEGAPAFWPWVQILRQAVATSEIGKRYAREHREIGDLIPELRSSAAPLPSRPDAQFRLFERVTEIVRITANQNGYVLLLDDLHWADKSSRRLLEFLISQVTTTRGLVVGAYRDLEGSEGSSQELSRLMSLPQAIRLRLGGLQREAIKELIKNHLPKTRLSEAQLRDVHHRSDGNPFFVIEACNTPQTKSTDAARWPPFFEAPANIVGLIRNRLAKVPDSSLETLKIAAVIGRTFSGKIVNSIVDTPEGEIRDTWDIAVQQNLITPSHDRLGSFEFAHALIREALYRELPPETRSYFHFRVAETLLKKPHLGSWPSNSLAESVAHHYFYADRHASPEVTIGFALQAAEKAANSHAHEEAEILYRRAFLLSESASSPEKQCDILIALGGTQALAGDWVESRNSFCRAAEVARTRHSTNQLALAGIGIKGLIAAAVPPDRLAVETLTESLLLREHLSPELQVEATAALSTALHFAPRESRRPHLADEALTLAQTVTPKAKALAIEAQIYNYWKPSSAKTALRYSSQLLDLGAEQDDVALEAKARFFLYIHKIQLGQIDALLELEAAERHAQEILHPKLLWQINLARASQSLASGNLEESQHHASKIRGLGCRCHDPTADQHVALSLLASARITGTTTEFDQVAELARKKAPDLPLARVGWACHLYSRDRSAMAHRTFRSCLEAVRHDPDANAFSLWVNCILAELAYLFQDETAAEQLLPLLSPLEDQLVIAGWGTALEGSISHFIGLLHATLGNHSNSRRALQKAINVNHEWGWSLLEARSQASLALEWASGSDGDSDKARHFAAAAYNAYSRAGLDLGSHPFVTTPIGRARTTLAALLTPPRRSDHAREAPVYPRTANQSLPTLVQDGEFASCTYMGKSFRLRNTKGVRQLSCLLQNPRTEIPSVLLAQLDSSAATPDRPASGNLHPKQSSPLLDKQAIREFLARRDELRTLIEENHELNDPAELAELKDELTWISNVLKTATNHRGRSRYSTSAEERARVSVRNNLTNTISKIARHSSIFGRHLTNSVKTGTMCVYLPEEKGTDRG